MFVVEELSSYIVTNTAKNRSPGNKIPYRNFQFIKMSIKTFPLNIS